MLTSRAGGRVLETHGTPGQRVKQGDLLVRFDADPLRTALTQARATLAQAANQLAEFEQSGRETRQAELEAIVTRGSAQVALLEAQAARLEPLHTAGLVADKALTEARQAAVQARLDLSVAQRAIELFQSSGADLQRKTLIATRDAAEALVHDSERVVADADVRSPCDGQLVEFTARSGARVDAGIPFARIFANSARVVAFSVSDKSAADVAIGARATWEDARGAACHGTIGRMAGSIDNASGMIAVFVDPSAESPALTVGAQVRGEIELRRIAGAVLVPEQAVLRADDQQVVVIATGGFAHGGAVEVLGRHAGLAAVRGAVHAGDHVIVDGGYNLPDGARIVETPR